MADVRELGSNRGFIKWPVDAACVGTTKAAEFIVQAFFFFFTFFLSFKDAELLNQEMRAQSAASMRTRTALSS